MCISKYKLCMNFDLRKSLFQSFLEEDFGEKGSAYVQDQPKYLNTVISLL